MEERKFIKGYEDSYFEIEDWFFNQIREFAVEYRKEILHDVLGTITYFPTQNGWSQVIGGVVKEPSVLFYAVEVLKQDHEPPLLMDVFEITSDKYLDLILDNNTIEYYAKPTTE